ncbi:MAG: MATE family efflux transporter [Aquificae bacterium]|nr:MATE family efflux transporter [Aquificota bacterium]
MPAEVVIREGTPRREVVRKVLKLAIPIILSNLLYTIQNFVSLLLVAPLGKETVGGVGFASTLLWFVYSTMATVYTGVSVLTAQSAGAGRPAGRYLLWGLLLSVLFSLPMALAGESFVRFFLDLFSTPPEVVESAVDYLRPVFWLLPFAFATNAINAAFNGLGRTKVIFYATVFTTAVNLLLAALLVYGLAGFPRLGAEGAGWAVAVAETLALFVYAPFVWREEALNPFKDRLGSLSDLWKLLKVGLPTGAERLIMSFSYNVFVGLVAVCGTAVLAAFQIGLRIESFSFTVGMAFAYAATTVAGQNFGAKNPYGVREGIKVTLRVAAAVMTLLGLAIGLSAPILVRFFSDDPQVVRWGTYYLWIIALSQPLMATVFVLAGAVRGLGKTHLPLAVNVLNFWLVRILPAMLLLKVVKSPFVPWGTMLAENLTRSLTYLLLWRRLSSRLRSPKGENL